MLGLSSRRTGKAYSMLSQVIQFIKSGIAKIDVKVGTGSFTNDMNEIWKQRLMRSVRLII